MTRKPLNASASQAAPSNDLPLTGDNAPALEAGRSEHTLAWTFARVVAEADGMREGAPREAIRPWLRHAKLAVAFFDGYYGNEIALLREKLSDALAANGKHWSDCAVYSAPAEEPGPCDCGGRS